MDKKQFMKKAIEEAYTGIKNGEGGPFGAIIVEGDKVLARGHNTVLRDNDPTHHAEINAINEACRIKGDYDLSGCVIYSTTEPCPMCFSAIHWARIDSVIFGTAIEDVKILGFNELAISVEKMKEIGCSPVLIEKGFMVEKCRELLKSWESFPDRKVY